MLSEFRTIKSVVLDSTLNRVRDTHVYVRKTMTLQFMFLRDDTKGFKRSLIAAANTTPVNKTTPVNAQVFSSCLSISIVYPAWIRPATTFFRLFLWTIFCERYIILLTVTDLSEHIQLVYLKLTESGSSSSIMAVSGGTTIKGYRHGGDRLLNCDTSLWTQYG